MATVLLVCNSVSENSYNTVQMPSADAHLNFIINSWHVVHAYWKPPLCMDFYCGNRTPIIWMQPSVRVSIYIVCKLKSMKILFFPKFELFSVMRSFVFWFFNFGQHKELTSNCCECCTHRVALGCNWSASSAKIELPLQEPHWRLHAFRSANLKWPLNWNLIW